MGDGYNFAQLKKAILAMSRATDWEVAKKEWKLVGISEASEPETCLCGHFPIVELCTISNNTTERTVDVGNVCVKRFLGFRSDLIFASLKRIRKDITKSVGSDATAFFYQSGIINDWEYGFQQNTMRKRNLSPAQLATRRKINEKIIASIGRRGIS
ncbi:MULTISPECIES: hypothetical protein [Stappiaceae]|uniref:hypothetical protein n=1 Tax=Stappiaceae TaxID=2821832 RepID=UPI00126824EA|nr:MULTISPECIES: hypothetical protein [Stappiaceae]MBO9421665.1 hypothetical protein [Labrenzia sp. R4_2]